MPTGLYGRREYYRESQRFTLRQNKSHPYENMGVFIFENGLDQLVE